MALGEQRRCLRQAKAALRVFEVARYGQGRRCQNHRFDFFKQISFQSLCHIDRRRLQVKTLAPALDPIHKSGIAMLCPKPECLRNQLRSPHERQRLLDSTFHQLQSRAQRVKREQQFPICIFMVCRERRKVFQCSPPFLRKWQEKIFRAIAQVDQAAIEFRCRKEPLP